MQTLGRQGEGPGEFADLTAAWPRGDTIEVYDYRLQRVTQFPGIGDPTVIRLNTLPLGSALAEGALRDGWLARVMMSSIQTGAPQARRDSLALILWQRNGTRGREIGQVEGLARYVDANGGVTPDLLSPETRVIVSRNAIYVGDTRYPAIRVLDPTSDSTMLIEWATTDNRSPGDVFSDVVDTLLARTPEERRPQLRERIAAAPVPSFLSVFWGFLVDDLGFIWIRPYEPLVHAHALGGWAGTGPGGDWLVVSPQGQLAGTIRLPDDLEPTYISTDAVVGVRRDTLGVESVALHALSRR
jgi:hypothetical protein